MALDAVTYEQRREALRLALRVRKERAAAKQELRAGTRSLADFVTTSDEVLQGTRVIDLLRVLPRKTLVPVVLAALGIDRKKTLRGLGSRQRQALLDAAQEAS